MRGLVLSLFPGIDLLGRAFEAQGWSVVWGPDVIYGRDIRGWGVPAGRFNGVIGGPPCQMFSALANIVRANGKQPKFGDLHPEFCRVVAEAQPAWWVCENVPPRGGKDSPQRAPDVSVDGYCVERFLLSPRWLGDAQSRTRRFQIGSRSPMGIAKRLPWTALEPAEFAYACTGGGRERPVKIGGSGKVKAGRRVMGEADVKRTHGGGLATNIKSAAVAAELARGQGWPGLDERLTSFTRVAVCQALGNGVPRVMAEAIATAINAAIDEAQA